MQGNRHQRSCSLYSATCAAASSSGGVSLRIGQVPSMRRCRTCSEGFPACQTWYLKRETREHMSAIGLHTLCVATPAHSPETHLGDAALCLYSGLLLERLNRRTGGDGDVLVEAGRGGAQAAVQYA